MEKTTKVPCIELYTDGGSRGNPGPAAAGVILLNGDKGEGTVTHLEESRALLGRQTNSQAEYHALIHGLQLCKKYNPDMLFVTSDSEFMIKQMTGVNQVRHPNMKRLYENAKNMVSQFKQVSFKHVYRTHPMIERCDALVNEALDNQPVLPLTSSNGSKVLRETSKSKIIRSELEIARNDVDALYGNMENLKRIRSELNGRLGGGIANQINRLSERIAVAEFNYKEMTK